MSVMIAVWVGVIIGVVVGPLTVLLAHTARRRR